MKNKTDFVFTVVFLLLIPLSIFARSEIITCPTLFEIHARETTGKQYFRWWTEDYNQYWRGAGVRISRYDHRQQDLAEAKLTIDMDDKGFIRCEYFLNNKMLGQLKLAKSGRYCHFMAERYQVDCQQNKRMCCNKPDSARCQVVMCSA